MCKMTTTYDMIRYYPTQYYINTQLHKNISRHIQIRFGIIGLINYCNAR